MGAKYAAYVRTSNDAWGRYKGSVVFVLFKRENERKGRERVSEVQIFFCYLNNSQARCALQTQYYLQSVIL